MTTIGKKEKTETNGHDSGERQIQGVQPLALQHDVIYTFTKFTLKEMCNSYLKKKNNTPVLHKTRKTNQSLWKSAQIHQDLKKFKTQLLYEPAESLSDIKPNKLDGCMPTFTTAKLTISPGA